MQTFFTSIRLWILFLFIVLGATISLENHLSLAEVIHRHQIIECTNTIRTEFESRQLFANSQLNQAAEAKLTDMQTFKYWAHRNPVTGKKPWAFFKDAKYQYLVAGENLAFGFTVGDHVCEAWKKSPSHFENLINPKFQEIGVATAKVELNTNGSSEEGILIVQMLGSRSDFSLPDIADTEDFRSASLLSIKTHPTEILSTFIALLVTGTGLMVFGRRKDSSQ